MSMMDELDAADKAGLFASNDTFVNYSTGILPLDYANGFWMRVRTEDGGEHMVPITGIIGGTFISIIGSTGAGKSTLADQIGFNVIKPFEDGMLFHIDCELTNLKQRMVTIMGCDPEDPRVRLKKDAIYIEDVMDIFNAICKLKETSGDRYKYEVVGKTYNNKPFKTYVPTVIVIDSLPSFNSKDNHDDESMGGNMDNARAAKDITRFFCNCLGRMQKYNITIMTINHIKPKVVIDRFNEPPKGLMMLKPAEMVTRGYAAQYYSQNYFRVESIKSNIYKKDDVGFEGIKATVQIAKTKTAFIGSTIDACLNGAIGFDPIYSLYEYAYSVGMIGGRNPWLYVNGYDQFKFNRKDFRHKFIGEPEFRGIFMDTVLPYLEAMLGTKEINEDDKVQYGDFITQQEEALRIADLQ